MARLGRIHNPMQNKEEIKREKEKRRKNMSEIAHINNCARKTGMSYGQYVSMQKQKMLRSQKESI